MAKEGIRQSDLDKGLVEDSSKTFQCTGARNSREVVMSASFFTRSSALDAGFQFQQSPMGSCSYRCLFNLEGLPPLTSRVMPVETGGHRRHASVRGASASLRSWLARSNPMFKI